MYISIEGNIGSGKSTLAKLLAKELKANYLPERFEENVLLPLFYNDIKTYAFPTEYSFLIDRHKQLVTYFNNLKPNKHTVSDFHFDKCICFAKANLSLTDYRYFKKHFKALQQSVVQPDLIIYITADVPLLLKNIEKRGRAVEQQIQPEYLKQLKKSLDSYYIKTKKNNASIKQSHRLEKTVVLNIAKYSDKTMEEWSKEIANIYL